MKKIITVLVLALPLLTAACNTFEGAGQDVSNGGHDLSNAAARNK